MKRTPSLTNAARELFEREWVAGNWAPGVTIPLIAGNTGLSESQTRDAIFGISADKWRRELAERLKRENENAGS